MKVKRIKLLFILFVIFILPVQVNAECKVEDKQKFIVQAKQITYKYKYLSDGKFEIIFNNVSEELEVINDIGYEFKNGEKTGLVYDAGTSRIFSVLAKENTSCPYEIIKEITVRFPIYNKFSENKECSKSQYKNFKYCKKFLYNEIDEKEWKKEFEKYKNKLTTDSENKNDTNLINIVIIGGSVLFVILSVIIFIRIKKRKERKF